MAGPVVLDLYVAFGQRRGQNPLHWMVLVVTEGSNRCIYYHVVGGPSRGRAYELQIQANKRFDSWGISAREFIGTIAQSDLNKLKASAQSITPQSCQAWVVAFLEDLERKGLVAHGTTATWRARMEPSLYEQSTPAPAESSSEESSS